MWNFVSQYDRICAKLGETSSPELSNKMYPRTTTNFHRRILIMTFLLKYPLFLSSFPSEAVAGKHSISSLNRSSISHSSAIKLLLLLLLLLLLRHHLLLLLFLIILSFALHCDAALISNCSKELLLFNLLACESSRLTSGGYSPPERDLNLACVRRLPFRKLLFFLVLVSYPFTLL